MNNLKIAIFDLDGTIDKSDTFIAFMFILFIKSPKRWIYFLNLIFGYLYFLVNPKFIGTNLKLLFLKIIVKNQNLKFVDLHAKKFVERRIKISSNRNILEIIKEYKRLGYYMIIASGSLDVYVKYFAIQLKFDEILSTTLEVKNNKFTGLLKDGNCIGEKKRQAIDIMLKNKKQSWGNVIFFSDHHSDLPVFIQSNKVFAVRPTKKLIKNLDKNKKNYKIID